MADFFIRRPTVAIVASIVITLLGLAVLQRLSIEQYPELSPPTIRVETTYQGAAAEVVEQSVATPIEQQVNGVDNMIYMKSLNTSDGRMLLDISFQVGMDRDMANVLSQNRVSQAQSRLPQEVNQQGVTVKKQNPSILMVISLYSPRGTRDAQFLNNYAMINVRDALLRVPGIATVDLYGGAEYGMRVWMRPDRMTALGLTPSDVISAIKEQNLQAPAGQVGGAPSPPGQEFTYTVKAPGRLVTAEEFENIILKQTAGGGTLRIKDVGRAELGSENYKSFGRAIVQDSTGQWLEGAAASLTVFLLPGANQLASAEGIYHTLEELNSFFPSDMAYEIVYDTTPAVEASIEAILHTLIEAFILVSVVVFVFLQSFRATIIPLLTVPVSLIGTFIFFPLLGFSINTLTMFGLVLAIGIVVDDAIVVVEAVIHHIEHGMIAQGRNHPGDEGGVGAGGGDRADPHGRVRPGGAAGRPHRTALPAVRPHHRDLGIALRLPGVEPRAGTLRDDPQAGQADRRAARRLLPRLQQGVRGHHRHLRELDEAVRPAGHPHDRGHPPGDGIHRHAREGAAGGVRARRGPGRLHA